MISGKVADMPVTFKRTDPLSGLEQFLGDVWLNSPIVLTGDFAQAQCEFALLAEQLKQFVPLTRDIRFFKIDDAIVDGVVGFAVIRHGIVKKDAIDVLVPT